jgi:hypothetical protein
MSLPRKRPKIAHPRCAVCKHPEKWRLELLRAGGASLDSLAAKFGLDRHAIHRHWHRHVSDEAKAKMLFGPVEMAALAEKAAAEGDSVLDYLRMCRTVLAAQLSATSEAGDARGAALVAGQLTRTLESIGRLTGQFTQLAGNITVNNTTIVSHPQFATVQATMLKALAPYPEARLALVQALRAMDEAPQQPTAKVMIEHDPR